MTGCRGPTYGHQNWTRSHQVPDAGRAWTGARSSGSLNAPHSRLAPCRLWPRTGARARKDSGAPGRLRVFDGDTEQIGIRLAATVRILNDDGPVKAYEYLHADGRNHVRHLGPSFGTKFLYFAGYDHAPGARQPLILDRYVALALNRLCGAGFRQLPGWTASQYADYLDRAHKWASAWDTSQDVIERVLFSVGKSDPLAVRALTEPHAAGPPGC